VGEFLKKCAAPCGFSAVGGPGPDSEICPTLDWENGAKSLGYTPCRKNDSFSNIWQISEHVRYR